MANTVYDNFFLSNEIEDQYQSHLDLQQFCTIDNTLTGVVGMLRKVHKYKATDGTEKLTMGKGNTRPLRPVTPKRNTVFRWPRTVLPTMTRKP